MFGIDSSEFAVIALVALIVIGPKDLPRVMRMVGQWVAKGRAMTRHVRSGFDEMMRQAELDEMQKQWAAQNDEIMRATALPDMSASAYAAPASEPEYSPPPVAAEPETPPKPKRKRAPAKPRAKAATE